MALKILYQCSASDKHENNVSCLVTLDSGHIVSGADDGILKLWTLELSLERQINTQSGGILSLAAGNDTLYTATSDQTIQEWQIPSLQRISTVRIDSLSPQKLFFEKENGILWVGDASGRVTQVEKGRQVAIFELTEEIWDLQVTTNPLTVYTARDRDVVIAEIVKGNIRRSAIVKGTIEGRYPILPLVDVICCLERNGRNIRVHENNVNTKFQLVREIPVGMMILNAFCRGPQQTIYTGGYDNDVSCFDITTGNKIGSVGVGSCVNALVGDASDAGAFAALSDGNIVMVGI